MSPRSGLALEGRELSQGGGHLVDAALQVPGERPAQDDAAAQAPLVAELGEDVVAEVHPELQQNLALRVGRLSDPALDRVTEVERVVDDRHGGCAGAAAVVAPAEAAGRRFSELTEHGHPVLPLGGAEFRLLDEDPGGPPLLIIAPVGLRAVLVSPTVPSR